MSSPPEGVPFPEYLGEIVARLYAVAGPRLVGTWLVGSASLGDFDPFRSDLDVQAVTSERLPRDELQRIAEATSHEALACPVRQLELVLYARSDLPRAAYALNLNTGAATQRRPSFDPADEPRFWFVLDLAIARGHAISLGGGPPSERVFPEPRRPVVVDALRSALTWYEGDGDDGQAVLAACRAWAWLEDGCWLSKAAAARWAIARLPDPAPVELALARRDDPSLSPPTAAQRKAIVARALASA